MVTTGFSRIHVARYSNVDSTVTYSGCRELARAQSMEANVETTDDNNFYANNRLAEQEPAQFKNGTATVVVDGLDPDEEAFILGIEATAASGDGVDEIEYGDTLNPPYMGIGAVKRQQLNGVVSFRPIIFTKSRFAIPSESAKTQEEGVSWQVQSLSATLLRDDTSKHNWKIIPKKNFESENEAVAWIRKKLNYQEAGA